MLNPNQSALMVYAVCRLVEAYEVHQKLRHELQVIKKHRLSAADASQYVDWFLS